MSHTRCLPFTAGKFLITPFIRNGREGGFAAALSVRRGQGTQTHDHVYAFKPVFDDRESALMYAAVQGRYWLINRSAFA